MAGRARITMSPIPAITPRASSTRSASTAARMPEAGRRIWLRDATLREGRDAPGVSFSEDAAIAIAQALAAAGLDEIEIVAPAGVTRDAAIARAIAGAGVATRRTGLIYATSGQVDEDVGAAALAVDRVEVLMPLSPLRPPADVGAKLAGLGRALDRARASMAGVGAGLPNATQVDETVVVAAARADVDRGADRVTLYDTNGSADPDRISALVAAVVGAIDVAVFFHAHDDLGLATANALAAVRAGATGLDVTVNGLGDRAGNASLEQVAMLLHLRGFRTGVSLDRLVALSSLVAGHAGIPVSPLAPVVGAHVFTHKSPGHLGALPVFEAYDPRLVGRERSAPDAETAPSYPVRSDRGE
jgi:homocitrate synthase NifV